ncbi:hypothetical protein R3P38DRAFT_1952582 [Favolaschia claudopus]|uniref:Uncharacterized protein n=1 Tax=Favolaschia claudopus TaxID=2862362 RepID=A0AAW0A120_9AGAR
MLPLFICRGRSDCCPELRRLIRSIQWEDVLENTKTTLGHGMRAGFLSTRHGFSTTYCHPRFHTHRACSSPFSLIHLHPLLRSNPPLALLFSPRPLSLSSQLSTRFVGLLPTTARSSADEPTTLWLASSLCASALIILVVVPPSLTPQTYDLSIWSRPPPSTRTTGRPAGCTKLEITRQSSTRSPSHSIPYLLHPRISCTGLPFAPSTSVFRPSA